MNYLEQARQRTKREETISIEEIRRRLDIPSEANGDAEEVRLFGIFREHH